MKWKDSDDSVEFDSEAPDKAEGSRPFRMRPEEVAEPIARRLLGPKTMPALVGGGLLVLLLLFVWLIFGSNDGSSLQAVNDLEVRIKNLEQRVATLEKLSANGPSAANQEQSTAEINKRIDGLEAVFTREIDSLANRLAELRTQRAAGVAPAKSAAAEAAAGPKAKPAAAAVAGGKPIYHVVKPGENLYRISRQYGLTLNELLRINSLKAGAPIHPGQKLRVSPK